MYIYGILFEIWIFWSQFFLTFFHSFDLHYYFFFTLFFAVVVDDDDFSHVIQNKQLHCPVRSNEQMHIKWKLLSGHYIDLPKTMNIILLMELAELAKQKNGCKRIKWLNGWLFSKKYFRPGIFIWLLFSSFRFVCSLLVCVCVIRVTLNFLFRFVENRIFT